MKKEIIRIENVVTDNLEGNGLDNLYLHVFEGEILGLIGINKYGMRHMLELICNNSQIKYGKVFFKEALVNHHQFVKTVPNKVYIIGREDNLLPNLSVEDNLFVVRKGFRKFFVNKWVLRQQTKYWLERFQLKIPIGQKVKYLDEFERCALELLKAYTFGFRLVIIDDISSRVSDGDKGKLIHILKLMGKDGLSAIIIGNHHKELSHYCDRIGLFKDGRIVKVFSRKELDAGRAESYKYSVSKGVSRKFDSFVSRRLRIQYHDEESVVNIEANAGECIALYDKSNQMKDKLLTWIYDDFRHERGEIIWTNGIDEKQMERNFLDREVAVIAENPLINMLFYRMSYIDNLCFLLEKKIPAGKITVKMKRSVLTEYQEILGEEIRTLDIRRLERKALYNLVYYRIHLLNPKLVFVIQPFSNTDMDLRQHILELIRILMRKGIMVIILTANIVDAMAASDRLLVVKEGRVRHEYSSKEFDKIRLEI